MDEIRQLLAESLNRDLYQIMISGAKKKEESEDNQGRLKRAQKRKVRPVLMKDELVFQISSYVGKQIFHENMAAQEAIEVLAEDVLENFGQMQVETKSFHATVLVSKKGKVTVKKKKNAAGQDKKMDLSHNRAKKYILEEGRAVPFLVDLGVQTAEGKIVNSRYDKFKQINRFLEFIADILPILPKDRTVHIIDFGCGKSYLTFAMYYYLHELKGLDLRVTGLDLKKDVIENCNGLAEKYGYEGLEFLHGDIADYTGTDQADMVVTLHACDTATDYALYKAVKWNAKVILSVPCCQHEVNGQIFCEPLEGALRYGLIKERLSALFTDALRANLLEEHGYDTQVLEFIDMEHTPKNILLRAVRRGSEKSKDTGERSSETLSEALHVHTTLQKLFEKDRGEQD
ncbi:MAG: SAM-dependent methyltransferase [Lachnospiraceae bacterium]|nr:SAM-dependent methyltransferase [Lachnospiraceae bacterium]